MVGDNAIVYSMKDALFLNNLELWIDEVISRDGLTDEQIIAKVNENFRRSIRANIEYHTRMAIEKVDGINNRHTLMAEIYKQMIV